MARPSLADMLSAASANAKPVSIINSRGTETSDWATLHDDARRLAALLQARGLGSGDRVALIGETTRELVTTVQSIWLCGAALTVLPLPGRLRDSTVFAAQTQAKLRQLQPRLVCGDPIWLQSAGAADQAVGWEVVELQELARKARCHRADAFDPAPRDVERLAILQFTSGSTSDPKAVMVPERCLLTNLAAMYDGFELDKTDRIMAWLPLFHDMGLIGILGLAMATGTNLVLADPGLFAAQPRRWMEWMSEFGATISCAPNFAYGVAARNLAAGGSYDLRKWRVAANGAEPIDVPTFEGFIAAARSHGFPTSSAFCVYGLAEATLAVTFPQPGTGLEVDAVDRVALEQHGLADPCVDVRENAKRLALLGSPLADFEIRVRGATGELVSEGMVGELEIRGASVTPGYLGGTVMISDGWLQTGDLAYITDGQLVISGRLKDMIIIAGRNIYPEDIEQATASVDGIRPGNIAAFGVTTPRGGEAVVIAAECSSSDHSAVRRKVAKAVRAAAEASPYEVVLLAPGALPKTTSGKLQRSRCKQSYLEGTLMS